MQKFKNTLDGVFKLVSSIKPVTSGPDKSQITDFSQTLADRLSLLKNTLYDDKIQRQTRLISGQSSSSSSSLSVDFGDDPNTGDKTHVDDVFSDVYEQVNTDSGVVRLAYTGKLGTLLRGEEDMFSVSDHAVSFDDSAAGHVNTSHGDDEGGVDEVLDKDGNAEFTIRDGDLDASENSESSHAENAPGDNS
jgi:hypothetical protein